MDTKLLETDDDVCVARLKQRNPDGMWVFMCGDNGKVTGSHSREVIELLVAEQVEMGVVKATDVEIVTVAQLKAELAKEGVHAE